MVRLALVRLGPQLDSVARVASRLRGGTITAVVEPTDLAAKQAAEKLGVAIWSTTTEELHTRHGGDFDAWVADTPVGWLLTAHLDRPLETRWERWSDNPTGWLWGHPYRFPPGLRTVKETLSAGKLGAPGLVRIHHWQARVGEVRHALLPQLDVATWLIEQRPTVVFAQRRTNEAGKHDYLQTQLGFADDRMAVIDCATGLPDGDDYYSLSVIGSTGAAYADDHHNQQLVFRGGHPRAVRTPQGDLATWSLLQEFIDAQSPPRKAGDSGAKAETDPVVPRPSACGREEWLRAQRLLAAVDESLTTTQAVQLVN